MNFTKDYKPQTKGNKTVARKVFPKPKPKKANVVLRKAQNKMLKPQDEKLEVSKSGTGVPLVLEEETTTQNVNEPNERSEVVYEETKKEN
jgi:hypothetical protein